MQPDGMLAKPLSMLPGGVDIAAKCASWLGQQLADAEHVAVLRDLTNLARKALGVLPLDVRAGTGIQGSQSSLGRHAGCGRRGSARSQKRWYRERV
jgi:hypothetical protein